MFPLPLSLQDPLLMLQFLRIQKLRRIHLFHHRYLYLNHPCLYFLNLIHLPKQLLYLLQSVPYHQLNPYLYLLIYHQLSPCLHPLIYHQLSLYPHPLTYHQTYHLTHPCLMCLFHRLYYPMLSQTYLILYLNYRYPYRTCHSKLLTSAQQVLHQHRSRRHRHQLYVRQVSL